LAFSSHFGCINKALFTVQHHVQAALDFTTPVCLQSISTCHKHITFGCNQFLDIGQCLFEIGFLHELHILRGDVNWDIKFLAFQWRRSLDRIAAVGVALRKAAGVLCS